MPNIHPTAIIDSRAELADDVSIGAYTIIKGTVKLGPGTIVLEHCHLHGRATIGRDCQIGPAAFLGLPPQHLKADPDVGQLIIGDNCIFREGSSVHRSTVAGPDHSTRIGNRVFMMGTTHVAHDCIVDDDAIFANGAEIGGHVHIGSKAFLGGGCVIHQYVRVGRLAIVGGNEAVTKDIPPFGACWMGGLKAYNAVGCRRAGLSRPAVQAIRAAYYCMQTRRVVSDAMTAIRDTVPDLPEIRELLNFIATSKRGIVPMTARRAAGEAYDQDEVQII